MRNFIISISICLLSVCATTGCKLNKASENPEKKSNELNVSSSKQQDPKPDKSNNPKPSTPMKVVFSKPSYGVDAAKRLVYQVGDKKVYAAEIDKDAQRIFKTVYTPKNIAQYGLERIGNPADIKNEMAYKKMQGDIVLHYIKSQKITPSKKRIETTSKKIEQQAKKAKMSVAEYLHMSGLNKDGIVDIAALDKLFEDAISDKKVDAFIKKYPEFFNGTTIETYHILREASPLKDSEVQQKAYDEIVAIQKDIKSGKLTMEEAIVKHSQCPSAKSKDGKKPGLIGPCSLLRLDPSYCVAVLNAGKGKFTDVVRSNFGYHLIQVADIKIGKQKVDPKDPQIRALAQNILNNLLFAKIMKQTRKDCKIKFMPFEPEAFPKLVPIKETKKEAAPKVPAKKESAKKATPAK